MDVINADPRLQRIINQMKQGYFGIGSEREFELIINHLTVDNDPYFTLRDFDSYVKAQEKVGTLYKDTDKWNQMSAINIAASGIFSSDNTIKRYAEEIWNV